MPMGGEGTLTDTDFNHKNDLMMCWDLHHLKHLVYENPRLPFYALYFAYSFIIICISVDVRMGTVYYKRTMSVEFNNK